MNWDAVRAIGNLLSGLGACCAALIGYKALTTWKRQLKGGNDYDLAKNLLAAMYRFRDRANEYRSFFASVKERDWATIKAEQQNLYPLFIDSRVHWGEPFREFERRLFRWLTKLWNSEKQRRELEEREHDDKTFEEMKRDIRRIRYIEDHEDVFGGELDTIISDIEKELHPLIHVGTITPPKERQSMYIEVS